MASDQTGPQGGPAKMGDGSGFHGSVNQAASTGDSGKTPSGSADGHPVAAPIVVPQAASSPGRRWAIRGGVPVVVLLIMAYFGIPMIRLALNTVSTDDAYVNSHVTFVAPRVAGQVVKVLVDDNNRVRKGDLIAQLDKEPYDVQVNIRSAAFESSKADLLAARDQVRGMVAQVRGTRFKLEHAMEAVNNQIATLRATAATWESKKATLARAEADLERNRKLVGTGVLSRQEFDKYEENFHVAQAEVKQALEQVYEIRVALGLPSRPVAGDDLTQVPKDLDQSFSTVRQAVGELLQIAASLGIFPPSYDATPKELVADFYKRDPEGNVDRIYEELMKQAPAVKQAEAKVVLAERDLDQARLNLRYTDVVAEIDGVVTRRNVNPGNNVQAGQGLMAIRSLSEIWIDANFKETQIGNLRIGQRVELEVDMYGRRRMFEGRITGFTMGTGSTLSLLPAQNATGNFIKVVQRLPVRIELINYNADEHPLFVGLSVVPRVYFKEPATGPDAGKVLQPDLFTGRAVANRKKQPDVGATESRP